MSEEFEKSLELYIRWKHFGRHFPANLKSVLLGNPFKIRIV